MSFDEQTALDFLQGKTIEFDQSKAEKFLMGEIEIEDKPVTKKQPELSSGIVDTLNRYAAGANDTLLNLLGLPGDAFNWVAEKMGAEGRVYGSEAIRGLGEKLEIGYAKGKEPDSAAYKAGEYTGMGLEFLVPILKYGKGALEAAKAGEIVQKGVSVPKAVAQRITAPFIQSPKLAMTSEITGSVGAGLGAYYGEKEYGQVGEMIGGLVGGLATAPTAFVVPMLGKYGKKHLFPYTKSGAKMKAGERLRELAETPDVVETITKEQSRVLPEAKISPAKLSGDRHLQSLEKEILKTDPALSHQFKLIEAETNSLARKEMRDIGGDIPIEGTQAYLKGRVEKIKTIINRKIDSALVNARDELGKIPTTQQRSAANKIISSQVDDALTKARAVETEAWMKVSQDTVSPTDAARDTLKLHLAERADSADKSQIPGFIYEFLGRTDKSGRFIPGKYKGPVTIKQMQTLRSRILHEARVEKAKDVPDWNKVRILNDIEGSMLDDISTTKASASLDEALEISRDLNRKFRGGVMDTILGHEKTGGRVAPEVSVEGMRSGTKAAVEINRIIEASPESFQPLEELMKIRIVRSNSIRDGKINLRAAKNFMEVNEDTMNIFPDLKNSMERAIAAEERSAWLQAKGKDRLAKVVKSAAAKISDAKPKRVLTEIMESKDPHIQMRKIVSQVNSEGKQGIKNDIVDYLFGKSKTSRFDENDMPLISGKRMANEWRLNKKVFNEALNEKEVARLEIVIETLKKNEGLTDLPEIGDIVPVGNKVINFIAGTLAARAGAKMGAKSSGASLRTASMATRAVQKIIGDLDVGAAKELLKDAIQDPALYKVLMLDSTKPPEMNQAYKVLSGWMLAHTANQLEEN